MESFIAGAFIGAIVLVLVCLVVNPKLPGEDIDTQPEFDKSKADDTEKRIFIRSIELVTELNCELKQKNAELDKELNYWMREAINNAAMLGEKMIAESKELCKKVDEFREENI